MGFHSKWVHSNLVYYVQGNEQRWIDAQGPEVAKVIENFASLPMAGADNPSAYTITLVEAGAGESTVALTAGAQGGDLLITTDANDNDGVNMQLTGEPFKFDTTNKYPCYFGISFQASEATQSDFLVGLAITDTTLLAGVTDGVYFECLDASTDINFVLEKDSTETTSAAAVGTFADATDVILEFYFDGTNIDAWVNGSLQTRLATTNLPDDEFLTPSIHFLTGDASAETMSVHWMRTIQINA